MKANGRMRGCAAWGLLLFLILVSSPAAGAEFTAEIVISGPGEGYTYSLHVKDPMYRIQKIKGPMNVPPFPSIVNRDTGMTWGLMPSMRQYAEMPDLEKTFLVNPLVGWAMTRKGMTETPGPDETVNGYACETRVYTMAGGSDPAAKVWIAKELGHIVREERFGGNKNAVLELRSIQVGPVDAALFEIPEGFTRVSAEGGREKPAPSASTGQAPGGSSTPSSKPAGASAAHLVFILDASGSMWGRVDGTPKIDIAKEVLTDLVKDLPEESVVGLVAYGHRRKGDCSDVEELIPPGRLDKDRMIRTVQGLSPKGKTPITLSVRKTVDRIRHVEEKTTIILVSDGRETCGGDPCALVKELKEAGIRFTLHVVGFDVTEEERIQLECMAKAGGGAYYTAKTAHEFRAAAQEVVRKTQEHGFLRLTALRGDKPFRAAVEVRAAGGDRVIKSGRTGTDPNRRGAPVNPGVYDLRFQDTDLPHSPEVWIRGVEVAAGETVERVAVFSEDGVLSIKAVKNNAPMKAYVKVFRQKDETYIKDGYAQEDGKPAEFRLLPGTYKVWLQDGSVTQRPEQWIENVEVKPGETVERLATFGAGGVLHVKAVKNNAPMKAYVKVFRQKDEKYMRDGYTREDGKPAEFKLLPGTYKVWLQDGSVIQRPEQWIENVEVKPGETVERLATFGAGGVLHVKAVKNNVPMKAYVKVFRQKDEKYMRDGYTREDGKPAEFKLLPGTYKVWLQDGSVTQRPEQWIENVEVKPGETVERLATFGAGGVVHVKAIKNNAPMKAYVKVFRQKDEKYMRDGYTREDGEPAEFKLLPGTYKVWLQDGSVAQRPEQWIENVEVKPDQTVERFATFVQGGVLRITATREGAPCKAYIKVFQQEDDQYLRDGWTRENGKADEFALLPGFYDVRVRDASDKSVRVIKDIRVASGKTTSANAAFPVEAEPAAEASSAAPAPAPQADTEKETPPSSPGKAQEEGQGLHGGEIPIMPGAKVLKESALGKSAQYELEVDAPVQAVLDYYTKAMADRGWPQGMVMNQAGQGAMLIHHEGRQFALKAKPSGDRTRITLMLVQP